MENERGTTERWARAELAGCVALALLAGGWWLAAAATGAAAAMAAAWLAFAGSLGWLMAWRMRHLRETIGEGADEEELAFLGRVGVPATRLAMALVLGHAGYALLGRADPVPVEAVALPGMALAGALAALAFVAAAFYGHYGAQPGREAVKAGVCWFRAQAALGATICGVFALSRAGPAWPVEMVGRLAAGVAAAVGAEAATCALAEWFRPRSRRREPMPPNASALLDVLTGARAVRRSLGDALNYQFGFEVSRSWFLRLANRSAWPMVLVAGGSLWLLSCMVVVDPGERVAILRLGRLRADVLGPGLHAKAPWPIDRVVRIDVDGLRRIHVGSHRPIEKGGEVYRVDEPVLWNNPHGLTADEMLIVAPPADMPVTEPMEMADGRGRAPSVSLVGVDVHVDYRIGDLASFLRAAADAEALFRQVAEAETSRALYRCDVDAVLGEGLAEAVRELAVRLREEVGARRLGIEVVAVGFSGAHPPQAVAAEFHETVVARQQREAEIQNAQGAATRRAVEMAGPGAADLLAAMERAEDLARADADAADLAAAQAELEWRLGRAEGYVAELLADAAAYRWARDHAEGGKAERFAREVELFRVGPVFYPRWRHLGVVERTMREARKFVLLSGREKTVLRFQFGRRGESVAPGSGAAGYLRFPEFSYRDDSEDPYP